MARLATSSNGRVYVANAGSDNVSVLDSTHRVMATIRVGDGPTSGYDRIPSRAAQLTMSSASTRRNVSWPLSRRRCRKDLRLGWAATREHLLLC